MKTAREIVEVLARDKRVETLCENICKRRGLNDLAQLVYVYLLECPDALLSDLYENGQIDFYIVRMIKNQYFKPRTRYYNEIIKFAARTVALNYKDYEQTD